LFADVNELKQRDRREAERSIHRRRHHTRGALLIRDLVVRLWGSVPPDPTVILEPAHIQSVMEEFMALHEKDMMSLFKQRSDHSQAALPTLRRLLGKMGLRLTPKRDRAGGSDFARFHLDEGQWQVMFELATSRHARQLQDVEKQQA
jgi:hypothetical protein